MIDEYAIDLDFKDIMLAISLGKKKEPFNVQDGFILFGNRLCVTNSLHGKVMYKSHVLAYARHTGIQASLKGVEANEGKHTRLCFQMHCMSKEKV